MTAAVLLTILVLAPSAPSSPGGAVPAADRETVVIGIAREPIHLHPLFIDPTSQAQDNILTTLFVRDAQWDDRWRLQPIGVERIPSIRDGTWTIDGQRMTLRWTLRPRTWHDGRPVSCGDYVFRHAVARDERVPILGFLRVYTNKIAHISCPAGASGREIVVAWKERDAFAHTAVAGWGRGALPRHRLEAFYRANAAGFDQTPFGHDVTATIGDGAYRLAQWRHGQSLTVEAISAHSILGTPRIKRISWRFIPQGRELVGQLSSGRLDVISQNSMSFQDALALERDGRPGIRVVFQPSAFFEHIDFNLDNPLLSDLRVRRAIAHAVNRQQIVQDVYQGKAVVAHAYLPPRHPGYTDHVSRYPYDPARARALLREAGFVPGADGIMARGSARLSLELNTAVGFPVRERAQALITEQLRQVGIEIVTVNHPLRVIFGELLLRRKFAALVLYALDLSPSTSCADLYASDRIPNAGNGWLGLNYPGYASPEMDRICWSHERELDGDRRIALLLESARIFSRDLPALPLYFRPMVAAAKRGLANYRPMQTSDLAANEMWNAHLWYWE